MNQQAPNSHLCVSTGNQLEGRSDAPPVDAAFLFNQCGGNAALALALLHEFQGSGMKQVDAVELHAARGNCAGVASEAHCLKGAAAIIGAESVRSLADRLESAGRALELAKVHSLATELRHEMEDCLSFIEQICQ